MRTRSILTATAIALVATVGSAVAAEQFITLSGVTAEAMDATEMDETVGARGIKINNGNIGSHGDSFLSDAFLGLNDADPRAAGRNPNGSTP